ncbi:SDR family oxidoreductase [Leifsonia soli]|uniref:NAD(P)-binding domain-containing protein n=1 Tax=Leifsonia soli TaxID=582665 RepID=A0A852T5C6_9MICO|nr:NAD-dependent epimerase/dehydratase family protein [Leifsonia soli]NYD76015.1 hypothetical protein [Leifsonia soli]
MYRIFLAGASGVIGRSLTPLLVGAGHTVGAMTRSPGKAAGLERLGAEPIIVDVFDMRELVAVVDRFQPDIIINELTDLPDDATQLPDHAGRNARMRTEGNGNLITAARITGVDQFLAQSVAWKFPAGANRYGVTVLERTVLEFGGVVLRYGQLYGPGTFYESDLPARPRVSVQRAAERTAELLEHASGVVVITD